jgi:hypothetical protein
LKSQAGKINFKRLFLYKSNNRVKDEGYKIRDESSCCPELVSGSASPGKTTKERTRDPETCSGQGDVIPLASSSLLKKRKCHGTL